jgi:hypothetical protein
MNYRQSHISVTGQILCDLSDLGSDRFSGSITDKLAQVDVRARHYRKTFGIIFNGGKLPAKIAVVAESTQGISEPKKYAKIFSRILFLRKLSSGK